MRSCLGLTPSYVGRVGVPTSKRDTLPSLVPTKSQVGSELWNTREFTAVGFLISTGFHSWKHTWQKINVIVGTFYFKLAHQPTTPGEFRIFWVGRKNKLFKISCKLSGFAVKKNIKIYFFDAYGQ